jgi:hypothetical protein
VGTHAHAGLHCSLTGTSLRRSKSAIVNLQPLEPVRRAGGKLLRQLHHVDVVPTLKARLANEMLFGMMKPAQADNPFIVWLDRRATAGPVADVCRLDGNAKAIRHRAAMSAHPLGMRRKPLAGVLPFAVLMEAAGEHQNGT